MYSRANSTREQASVYRTNGEITEKQRKIGSKIKYRKKIRRKKENKKERKENRRK
jgi:hypothetical protein